MESQYIFLRLKLRNILLLFQKSMHWFCCKRLVYLDLHLVAHLYKQMLASRVKIIKFIYDAFKQCMRMIKKLIYIMVTRQIFTLLLDYRVSLCINQEKFTGEPLLGFLCSSIILQERNYYIKSMERNCYIKSMVTVTFLCTYML